MQNDDKRDVRRTHGAWPRRTAIAVAAAALAACLLAWAGAFPQDVSGAVAGVSGLAMVAAIVAGFAGGKAAVASVGESSETPSEKVDDAVRHEADEPEAREASEEPGESVALSVPVAADLAPAEKAPVAVATSAEMGSPSPDEGEATQEIIPAAEQVTTLGDRSAFDAERFERELTGSPDPLQELRLFVQDIRTRESGHDVLGQERLRPSEFELFCARELEEAGVMDDDLEMPATRALMLTRSHLFYLRIEQPTLTYAAKLRVIRIEAALNRIRFCAMYFEDVAAASQADAYLLNERIEQAMVAQVTNMVPEGEQRSGTEWDTRLSLGLGIETFQTPYRLTADYRVNVRERVAAIRIDLTPPGAFDTSCYSLDIGRIVPTTRDMRARAASDYALRLGILLAAYAFGSSPAINECYVMGVLDDSKTHACYYSVCFDRTRFGGIDLERLDNLPWHYRCFAARMRMEDGVLKPVEPTFSLEDERFCPPSRYDSVELSHALLKGDAAQVLGTTKVSGLAIDEQAHRQEVAGRIVRGLGSSTEANVRAILDATRGDADESVQEAARRTMGMLIDGTLEDGDAISFEQEFVAGGELSHAVETGWRLLGKADATGAARLVRKALTDAEANADGAFRDTGEVEWRSFNSYAERALYNRMIAGKRSVRLVPEPYYEAHMLLGGALLDLGKPAEALVAAERALQMDPLDANPYLMAVKCSEELGDYADAADRLGSLLAVAHDAESVGKAYYRMAFMQYHLGRPDVAEACYLRCLEFASSVWPVAAFELASLRSSGEAPAQMTNEQAEGLLLANGIALAPVERVSKALYDCGRASLDSELFGVARTCFRSLGTFLGDDVLLDVIRSIEKEPDR